MRFTPSERRGLVTLALILALMLALMAAMKRCAPAGAPQPVVPACAADTMAAHRADSAATVAPVRPTRKGRRPRLRKAPPERRSPLDDTITPAPTRR